MAEDAVAPLATDANSAPLSFADRAVRGLLPLGLEAARLGAAAAAVRAFPALVDVESARQMMFALEKTARAHAAPELLVRAAHGVCACALSLGLAEARDAGAEERSRGQLVSALVRLVTTVVKAGVPAETVVRCLAGPDG